MNALTHRLQHVDGTAPSIHAAAAELMRHYDHTAKTAVLEWRNALFNARIEQIIPLLYVCNEVLQNSRRNRGNKFIDAFGPILPQSIEYMAEQLSSTGSTTRDQGVEKIRRTVKIWGQRQVCTVRFINDLLQRLDRYRQQGGEMNARRSKEPTVVPPAVAVAPSKPPPPPPRGTNHHQHHQQQQDHHHHHTAVVDQQQNHHSPRPRFDSADKDDDDDDDNSVQIVDGDDIRKQQPPDDDADEKIEEEKADDDDDDDLFGSFSNDEDDGLPKLEIDVKIGAIDHDDHNNASTKKARKQRSSSAGRPSTSAALPAVAGAVTRRTSVLSSANLVDLWKQLAEVQEDVDLQIKALKLMRQKAASKHPDVSSLVGDKLQLAAQLNHRDKLSVLTYRRKLFRLAHARHAMEQQAVRYYQWLAQGIVTDHTDLDLADTVELKLQMWSPLAEQLVAARQRRRQQERQVLVAAELQRQRQREDAEAAAFRAAALAKETQAKPGMVWNPTTREYVALNTDESWRDN